MKTIAKIISVLLLLAVIYFVACDGMMVHFGFSQGVQYAFNFGAILCLIPFCIYIIFSERVA